VQPGRGWQRVAEGGGDESDGVRVLGAGNARRASRREKILGHSRAKAFESRGGGAEEERMSPARSGLPREKPADGKFVRSAGKARRNIIGERWLCPRRFSDLIPGWAD
jgi:hypothetical protein